MNGRLDPELVARVRAIMLKLELLSEAPAANLDGRTSHGKVETKVPPGADPDRSSSEPPPKKRSLWEWYRWQFDHAASNERVRLLCYLAERDYSYSREGLPRWKVRGALERGGSSPDDEQSEMKRVVDWYVGVDILEVAVLEERSVGWVRKAREQLRREVQTGEPRPGWFGWDDEQRTREVAKLKARGFGEQAIADRLETSRRQVRRYAAQALARVA